MNTLIPTLVVFHLHIIHPIARSIKIGASRYQSTGSSVPSSGNPSAHFDPFTGASRYSGAQTSQALPPTAAPASKPVLPLVITPLLSPQQYY